MRHSLKARFSLAAAAMYLPVHFAAGQPVAYDGFNYSVGSPVTGLSGGNGWASAWANPSGQPGNPYITASSLPSSYPGSSGNRMSTDGLNTTVQRSLQQPFTQVGNVMFASVLLRPVGMVGTGAQSYGGFSLLGAGTSPWGFFAGKEDSTDLYSISDSQTDAGTVYTNVQAIAGQTVLLLVKFENLLGPDRVSLWVNPDMSLGTPPPLAVKMNSDLGGVTGILLHAGSTWEMDEVRVGLDFCSVVPSPAVSSLAILGFLAIDQRRRRRK